jgi:hypothetical protein
MPPPDESSVPTRRKMKLRDFLGPTGSLGDIITSLGGQIPETDSLIAALGPTPGIDCLFHPSLSSLLDLEVELPAEEVCGTLQVPSTAPLTTLPVPVPHDPISLPRDPHADRIAKIDRNFATEAAFYKSLNGISHSEYSAWKMKRSSHCGRRKAKRIENAADALP